MAKKTLAGVVEDVQRFALFCDNLTGQTSEQFKKAVSDLNGIAWFGLPNVTDLWQVVDAGYAQLLKTLTDQAFHTWLDDDEQSRFWYGQKKDFTAKDRRVMITN